MQSFSKKRHRFTNHRHSTPAAEASQKLRRSTTFTSSTSTTTTTLTFNDASTADVILRLCFDTASPSSSDDSSNQNDDVKPDDTSLFLHSEILTRAKYFSALLSDRWHQNSNSNSNSNLISINLTIPRNSLDNHITMFNLLYSLDFTAVVTSVSTALDLLPLASQFLFEDCVKHSVNFLEAVPWTEEEENGVINVIPFLNKEESDLLLARVRVRISDEEFIENDDSCEDMLHDLILSAMHCHPSSAYVKAFVAKLLRDFSSKESARIGLERAFEDSLRVVKESLEEYASPDFRSGTGDYNEMEAIQRISLHTALTNGKHLLWLVERMIELRVADNAVIVWSEQSGFAGDLQRAFQDDAWRNIVPGLPAVVLRCTAKLANAVATGAILAARQVRMKLVKDWLPVLIVCKDHVPPMLPSQKSLYLELEETFLKIISTLPMSDAQELLRQCLSFSTRNVEDCPHLVTAFNTWFRRAMRPPPGDPL